MLGSFWKNHFNRLLAAVRPAASHGRRTCGGGRTSPRSEGLPREIQNLLILVYADQTNRSFVRYGGNYTPSLDDLPNELELQEQTLPDLKDWEEAVTRVADIFGHAISKLLNASNLATLAAKVGESITEFRPDCDSLPDRLQLVLKNLGVREDDAAQGGSGRTAKAVKALLASCDGKEPTKLVGAIAQAKLRNQQHDDGTQPEVGQRRAGVPADHPLGSLLGGCTTSRASGSRCCRSSSRMSSRWLKTDEHALAGGLAAKLSEAEGRAIKLLTPPKPIDARPRSPPLDAKTWSQIGSGKKDRLTSKDWSTTAEELHQKLEENPRYRLTIQWTLEEEPQ